MPDRARQFRTRCAAFVIAAIPFGIGLSDAAAQEPGSTVIDPASGADWQTVVRENARAVSAADLDSRLPAIRLDHWLLVTFAQLVENPLGDVASWELEFCAQRHALPSVVVDACVESVLRISADRTVHIMLIVGTLEPGTEDVSDLLNARWQLIRPTLREIYIEALEDGRPVDSLDVPALGDIQKMLEVPVGSWPAVDLRSKITWTPATALPGDTVQITVWVANVGRRRAEPARVNILLGPCCESYRNIEWFPIVGPGEAVRLDRNVLLPEGMGLMSAAVSLLDTGGKRVREVNRDDNDSDASIESSMFKRR